MKAIQCCHKVQLPHLKIFCADSWSSKAGTMSKERDRGEWWLYINLDCTIR